MYKKLAHIIAWTGIAITIIPGMSLQNNYNTIFIAIGMVTTMTGALTLITSSRTSR